MKTVSLTKIMHPVFRLICLFMLLAGVFCGLFVLYVSYKVFFTPPPPPQEHAVWIPENAEVYPHDRVNPGTFKITFPIEEFQATQENQAVLVVYTLVGSFRYIDYYRPKGNVFEYTRLNLPYPSWILHKSVMTFDAEKGVVIYKPKVSILGVFATVLVLLILSGILIYVGHCGGRALKYCH